MRSRHKNGNFIEISFFQKIYAHFENDFKQFNFTRHDLTFSHISYKYLYVLCVYYVCMYVIKQKIHFVFGFGFLLHFDSKKIKTKLNVKFFFF